MERWQELSKEVHSIIFGPVTLTLKMVFVASFNYLVRCLYLPTSPAKLDKIVKEFSQFCTIVIYKLLCYKSWCGWR